MGWKPFFFDCNTVFGIVDNLNAWEKIRDACRKARPDRWEEFLKNASQCPDPDFIHPSDEVRGEATRAEMPNFGCRMEHTDCTNTLAVWAPANGMFDLLFLLFN